MQRAAAIMNPAEPSRGKWVDGLVVGMGICGAVGHHCRHIPCPKPPENPHPQPANPYEHAHQIVADIPKEYVLPMWLPSLTLNPNPHTP